MTDKEQKRKKIALKLLCSGKEIARANKMAWGWGW
jgi:hypothetical protein